MGKIGFHADRDKEHNHLEEANSMLTKELAVVTNLERELIRELKEVQHLETNLKIAKKKFDKFQKLYEKREHLIKQAMKIADMPDDKLDVDEAEKILGVLRKFDTELDARIKPFNDELYNLYQHSIQKVHVATDNEKVILQEIEKKARDMVTEFLVIRRNARALDGDLSSLSQRIQHHKQRNPSKVGF